jgi:hypothetical protein
MLHLHAQGAEITRSSARVQFPGVKASRPGTAPNLDAVGPTIPGAFFEIFERGTRFQRIDFGKNRQNRYGFCSEVRRVYEGVRFEND